jgi:hypothetical protein
MQTVKTAEELKMAIINRKMDIIEREMHELKILKVNRILKELKDLKIDNLICIYIEAKLKNKKNHLPDYALASIEDLEDLIITHNKLEDYRDPYEDRHLPF